MKQNVLLVTDDADTLEAILVGLAGSEYKVLIARSGLEAIKRAPALLPDLLILDSTLSDMDGATVRDILGRLPSTTGVPMLLLTDWSEDLARTLGMASAGNDSLAKPFASHELLPRVNQILARSHETKLELEDQDVY